MVPWELAGDHCWRCGLQGSTERCHIIPASRGGTGKPENLVRLCNRCHREQPNVCDAGIFWQWFKATRHDGAFRRQAEWVDEYERIFGEPPCTGDPSRAAHIAAALKIELDAAVMHFGEGRLNAATMAAAVRLAEQKAGR